MVWILLFLLLLGLGLAGGYWVTHGHGMDQFWQLAGLGVFMMFLLIGVGTLAKSGGRRR